MIYSMYTGFNKNIDTYGIDKALNIAIDWGFSGVEFFYSAARADEVPSTELGAEYGRKIRERGLSVACVSMGATIVHPEAPDVINESAVAGLIKGIEFAAAVGSKLFHHTLLMGFGYKIPEDFTVESKRELFLEGARRVATRAAELGVSVIYEPQGPFFNGFDEFCRLLSDMRKTHSNIGICCDFGNPFWVSEEPYKIYEELSHLIRHVHIKDYNITYEPTEGAHSSFRGGAYIREVPAGEGDIDIPRISKILREAGYSGTASLEDLSNVESAERTRDVIARMREILG